MKKGVFILFGIFLCIFFFYAKGGFAVNTGLNIENSPPYLISLIPNQSWQSGDLVDIFDLDDYFGSTTNLTLNYSSSAVQGITVVIDSSPISNNVSFYPDGSFSGVREVIFYASDGTLVSESNLVYLFVAIDDDAPKWSNLEKDKGVIYQNDYVTFTSNWTDNFGLKNNTFFIKQGTAYDFYFGDFSGLSNESNKMIQISSSSGNNVSWFFCATDTSNNLNCTEEKSFIVAERVFPATTSLEEDDDDDDETSIGKIENFFKKDVNNFEVSSSSFLVSLKQGSVQTKILEIINTGNTELNFNISVEGLGEFVILGATSLIIAPGETKKIAIDFFSKKDTLPGHYFGEIKIISISNIAIPVVFEVNPLESDVEISLNVLDEFKSVKPGETVVANITFKNLKDLFEKDIDLHLSLMDFSGNIYAASDEKIDLALTTSVLRNFSLSEDIPLSEYFFYARASYEDSVLSISSDIFEVGIKFKFLAFIKSSSIFLLIIFLSLFSVLLILRYRNLSERKQNLSLYVQSLELKKLMALNKFDEAVDLFMKMKNNYGEPITKDMLEDKEELKSQMKNLSERFNLGEDSLKEAIKKPEKENKDKEELNEK